MADYYVVTTNIGEAKMANALALGIPLEITELAVGDGEGDGARGTPAPDPEQTQLVSERRRAPINSFAADPDNENVLVAEQVIPETAGGFWIREMGLFDADGDMLFVCNTPPTYKPQLSEGSGRTQVVRMAMIISDTASVTLKVDPSVVLATREHVSQAIEAHSESTNHPYATTNSKGMVQLAGEELTLAGGSSTLSVHPKGLMSAISEASTSLTFLPHYRTITDRDRHRGLQGGVFPLAGKWIVVWRDAEDHVYDGAAVIKAADTIDQGKTLINVRTVYEETTVDPIHPAVAIMDGGRLGMVVARRPAASGDLLPPVFVYSDDNGDTWSSNVITGAPPISPHDFMQRYPASVGGHDTQGYWLAGYEVGYEGETNKPLHGLYTTDNGLTWDWNTIVPGLSTELYTEPTVTRLGNSDRWIMLVRRNHDPVTGGYARDLNAEFWKSTDLINWEGPYDTGQRLGFNPPHITYRSGRVEWFAFSREYMDAPIPVNGEEIDALLFQSAEAERLWESNGNSWSGWKVLSRMPRPVGYMNTFDDVDGNRFAIFAINENRPSKYCQLSLISTRPFFDYPPERAEGVAPIMVSPTPEVRGMIVSAVDVSNTSMAAGETLTLVDVSGPAEMILGVLIGSSPQVSMIVDGLEIFPFKGVAGKDIAGDVFGVFTLPAVRARSSLQILVKNDSASARDYGWRIMYRQQNTAGDASRLI